MTGFVGGSVNFTWTFNGNVQSAQLERENRVLISLDKTLTVYVPSSSYSGRISVFWDGKSPGQVTFLLKLSSITDEGKYQCRLTAQALDDIQPLSGVELVVLGKCALYHFMFS